MFEFAKKIFPNISPEVAERNGLELNFVQQSQQKCKVCLSLEMCDELTCTAGYVPTLRLNPNGWMSVEMTGCEFNKNSVRGKPEKLRMEPDKKDFVRVRPMVQEVLNRWGCA